MMHFTKLLQDQKSTLDLTKYKRFFAFGCSMTNYAWPTWADMLSVEIPEFYNYGRSGAGNLFISNSIVEANKIHKFNKEDLIIVMWSSTTREDRYVNRNWETPGNIYTQNVFDETFVTKWADERFYMIRDMALVETSFVYLKHLDSDFHMLQMMPFQEIQFRDSQGNDDIFNQFKDVLELYSDTLSNIHTDLLTAVCKGKWPMIKIEGHGGELYDYHPTPKTHLQYLEKIFDFQSSKKMKQLAEKYNNLIITSRKLKDLEEDWKEDCKNKLGQRL